MVRTTSTYREKLVLSELMPEGQQSRHETEQNPLAKNSLFEELSKIA